MLCSSARHFIRCLGLVQPNADMTEKMVDWDVKSQNKQNQPTQKGPAGFVCYDLTHQSSISEMISSLSWNILQQRRDGARSPMLYKIKHNHMDITCESPLEMLVHPEATLNILASYQSKRMFVTL